jgi:adenosine kinase
MSEKSYALFCMGNPLLDIQVTNGEQLLKKYNLNPNDAILAEEKHLPMLDILSPILRTLLTFFFKNSYDEIVKEHQVVYVAGGAAQNAARGAAVCSHSPCSYIP